MQILPLIQFNFYFVAFVGQSVRFNTVLYSKQQTLWAFTEIKINGEHNYFIFFFVDFHVHKKFRLIDSTVIKTRALVYL